MTTKQRSQNITLKITTFAPWLFSSLGTICRKFGLRSLSYLKYGCSAVLRISLQTVWSRFCVFLCLVPTLSQNIFELSQFVFQISIEKWGKSTSLTPGELRLFQMQQ